MKTYIVLYYIKANRRQTAHTMMIEAKNASEACKETKRIVFEQTGRNAFRPQATIYEEGMTEETLPFEFDMNEHERSNEREFKRAKETHTLFIHWREDAVNSLKSKAENKGFKVTFANGEWKVRV